MTKRTKILIGILAIGVILIGVFWIWEEYFAFKPYIPSPPTPISKEVTIATDKTEYERGESITIEIKNVSSEEKFITYPSIDKFENGEWIPIKFVWSGCWVLGGLPYLPLESNESFDYQWDQKEKWCSDNPQDLNVYSQDAEAGIYRIKGQIIERTKSKEEDPVNISGKPSGKFIYSNEFTIKEKQSKEQISEIKLEVHAPMSRATIVIDNQGVITYEASGGIGPEIGKQADTGKISKDQYNDLVRLILDNDFFSFKNSYVEKYLMDATTYIITVKKSGQIKSVSCYGTCPDKVIEIREKIKKLWGKDILEVGM